MKSLRLLSAFVVGVFMLPCGTVPLFGDITVRLSVKFILNTNGAYPMGIGTNTTFQVEVDRGNSVLADTSRGYRLEVIEYLPIRPPVPAGQPANYWFTNNARSSRAEVEAASIADPVSWRRNNAGALNIYVNNSASGQCSFVGRGDSITLGASISTGTVLHEIGHFFDLSHTHDDDPICSTFNAVPPLNAYLTDGDGLVETIPDHPCFTSNQLSQAYYNTNYLGLTPGQRAIIDTVWRNVMSYHQEDQLLSIQMDYWTANANRARQAVCSGRTWFVATDGADRYEPFFTGWNGLEPGTPWQTLNFALNYVPPDVVRSPDDVVLLRAGTYLAPQRITTACTLRATRGPVRITR